MENNTQIYDSDQISLNTHDEVDQILGNPPSWILRWGLTLVFIAVVIFGMLSWLIKYPDVVPASINISTENPSIAIVARTSGEIKQIFVKNNQVVKENDILAIIDNPASFEDILVFEEFLFNVENLRSAREYKDIESLGNLDLGILQNGSAALDQKISDYKYFLRKGGELKKVNSLEAQIKYTEELTLNMQKQKEKLAEELRISEKDVKRNRSLNATGLIPDSDLEKIETQFLQYQRQLDVMESQIVKNNITIEQLETQIVDLSQNRKDGRSTRELSIKEDIKRIKSDIETWKQTYLITAPISGKASLSGIWTKKQFVNANEEVLTIVPVEGVGKTVGKIQLPIANSGKVKVGQQINISLDGFPDLEYGILKAKVEGISLVPKAENYLVETSFSDSLITSYGKHIPFRQKMSGTAKIVTEDRRVLERIFERVNSLLKN